jgi:lipopolysaccharide transport system ATP-binding protein
MEYDVLRSGYILLPYYDIYNGEGLSIFSTLDVDPEWRQRPRPKGRWISIVEIPGNLLAEGTHVLAPGLSTLNPPVRQFQENEALAFHVVDSLEGNSARGDWAGKVDGVIRPLLKWRTEFSSDLSGSTIRAGEATVYRE